MTKEGHDKVALITGASSGIGFDLAHIFASNGFDLVVTARSTDKLLSLKKAIESKDQVRVEVITKDLSLPTSPEEVYREVKALGLEVNVLVNNAGYGGHGRFTETNLDYELKMMQLNVVALTHLTKLFVKDMVARGEGRILNVASTAAFQPGPYMSVYYATKAFVLSFSEAVRVEVKGSGVTVTTLCPGMTLTGFLEAANIHNTYALKMFTMKSGVVAKAAYKACMRGKAILVTGWLNKFFAFMTRLTPRCIVHFVVKFLMTKSRS